MPSHESPSVSVSRRSHRRLGSDALRTVVWVRGEHDVATRAPLLAIIAEAAQLDDVDIVVDLSGVTYMDTSTIGALVVARNHLRGSSRSLSIRAPSPRARRLLDLCGLTRLIDEGTAPKQAPVVTALGTWVDVPASDRLGDAAPTVAQAVASEEPASDEVRRPVDSAMQTQRRRAPK